MANEQQQTQPQVAIPLVIFVVRPKMTAKKAE